MSSTTESKIELVVRSRERDLGGFSVRRLLPYATHRMVGPFIFFDHMGPASFPPGEGMTVRPHPHIGLATVTYLFEGKILHRDSLGSLQLIEPGAINWMTAGRGIVHSERTPEDLKALGCQMNGIQCWVALPEEHEDTEPSFMHHPAHTLPEFEIGGVKLKLLVGRAFGYQSPVRAHSELFYLDAQIPANTKLTLPAEGRESAIYVVSGKTRIEDQELEACSMAVAKKGEDLTLEALEPTRVMLLGGEPIGSRHIWWNLVSSSVQKIEDAKADWAQGPREGSPRFARIPGDDQEFIPLPNDPGPSRLPKGTVM